MSPPRGTTPPPYTNIVDISDNYERISTKFSAISLLTRSQKVAEQVLKYVTPSWGNPPPTF